MPGDTLIADAHNDLLMELVLRRHEESPFRTHWLPPLRAGGVRLQITPVYTELEPPRETALRRALAQVAAFHRALRENPAETRAITCASDVTRLSEDDRIGMLLAVEGAEPWEDDDELADDFWQLGVRMAGLTWNFRNVFADGVGESPRGGLSARGVRLVERLCERGMILDLSHASEQTFRDVLAISGEHPVLVSHANCRSVLESARNVSDAQMEAIAGRGGVLGMLALPFVVDPDDPTIDRLVDHIDHAVAVMGIEHVVLGGDFFAQIARAETELSGVDPEFGALTDLAGPEHYPALVDVLRRRGYEGGKLAAILGGNLVRFLQASLPAT
ncbi:MAG: rane dipeptidase [Gaiellales bacterium]|nr:rane dipeptidase [Gaiellales bacterium]